MIEKIKNKEVVVGVVGLGYVGLPLMLAFATKGYRTIGFDIDDKKVEVLSRSQSYIEHIDAQTIEQVVADDLFEATTNFARVEEVDAVILCVPTPLDRHYEPDLSYVVNTMDTVAPYLRQGQLISLESTTYPGTTEEELRPRIESRGFTVGEDIYLVYSPEREDPGNARFSSRNIPKVLGGSTPVCMEVGQALYEAAVDEVVPVKSTRVAEFAKLLENIYRCVNIGLVNEMKIAAEKMGVDIWEVIEAASTKPFGFTPFYPGPGLGGHCIPIDPYYLTWKAKEFGVHTRFIELAGEVNRAMPEYVLQRCSEALNDRAKPIKGSKVLLMGLAYKSDVDDMRESPAFDLLDLIFERGAQVDYYDPHIQEIGPTREHSNWEGQRSIEWSEQQVRSYDLIVIVTDHKLFDLSELLNWGELIVDTRNAIARSGMTPAVDQVWKA